MNLFKLFFTLLLAATLVAETPPVPDPIDLKSNWWEFFKVDKENLPAQVAAFDEKLKALRATLDEKQNPDLINLIDRASLNLKMLIEEQGSKENLVPEKLLLLPQYGIDQLLAIVKNLNRVQFKIDDQTNDLDRLKNVQRQRQQEIDQYYLDYAGLPKGSPARLAKGVAILAARFEIALTSTKMDKIKERIEFLQNERLKIKDELTFAQNSLTFTDLNSDGLQKNIDESSLRLEQARRQLLKYEKNAFSAKGEDPGNLFVKRLWDQRVLGQTVAVEIAKTELMVNQIKYHLFLVATGVEIFSTNELQALITDWKEEIEEEKQAIVLWEETIQEELERIGKEVSQTADDSKTGEQKQMEMALNLHLEIDRSLLQIQGLKGRIEDAQILLKEMGLYLIQERSIFETWTLRLQNWMSQIVDYVAQIGNTKVFQLREAPVTLWNFVQAILIFLSAIVASRLFRKVIFSDRYFGKKLSKPTEYVVSRALHYLLMIIGFFAALSWIGLDFTNFLIIAGALGVGIGFGLQTIVNNIISGFMLLFQRHLKIGDIIEMEDKVIGRVAEINLQNTRIHSFDGIDIVVPNNNFTSQKVVNWTLHDYCRRYRIPFSASYDTDKEFLKKVIIEGAKKIPSTIHSDVRYPDPQVWLAGFGDSCINFELIVWVNLLISLPHGTARSNYLWMIDSVLKENNIHIPYNQLDVRIKEMPEKQ